MATRYPAQADDDQADRDEQVLQEYLRSQPKRTTRRHERQPTQGLGTAFIKRHHAAWLLRLLTRGFAVALLYGSWHGTAMLVAGYTPNPWWQLWHLPIVAIGVGFIVQAPLTLAEFANRHRRHTWGYRAPLAVDIITTFLGYRGIAVPWLLTSLTSGDSLETRMGATAVALLANVIAFGLAWFMAQFPELVAVDD